MEFDAENKSVLSCKNVSSETVKTYISILRLHETGLLRKAQIKKRPAAGKPPGKCSFLRLMKSEGRPHFPSQSESIHISSKHQAENSKHGTKDYSELGQHCILAPGPSAGCVFRTAADSCTHTGLFRFLTYHYHNQKQGNHKG